MPHDIAASFIIVGRTEGGIPFGGQDGTLTRLFFLICCKDDRTHLHALARLSRMLEEETIASLLAAPDAQEVGRILKDRESAVLGT